MVKKQNNSKKEKNKKSKSKEDKNNNKNEREGLLDLNLIKNYLFSYPLEFLILILSVSLVFFFTFESFHSLKSLPTCIYGCDYYWEHGNVLGVLNNPFKAWQANHHLWLNESDQFPLSSPKASYYLRALFYLPFDYYESWKGTIIYSLFFSLLSFLGYFLLFRILFRNNLISLILAFVNLRIQNFPYFKYNNIVFLLLPWLILSIYWIFFKFNFKNKKHWFLLLTILIFYLIFSNLHAWAFFGLFYFIFFGFIIKFLLSKNKEERKNSIIKFLFISILSFFLALLLGWWFYVIFHYWMETKFCT